MCLNHPQSTPPRPVEKLSFTELVPSAKEIGAHCFKVLVTGVQYAAAAAKSLQLCPTLCDPIDGSPPGSPVPGILQARTLEWVAGSSSNACMWKVKVKSLSRVRPSAIPWTVAFQAPPSMGFSRQEYCSGVPLPSPGVQYSDSQFLKAILHLQFYKIFAIFLVLYNISLQLTLWVIICSSIASIIIICTTLPLSRPPTTPPLLVTTNLLSTSLSLEDGWRKKCAYKHSYQPPAWFLKTQIIFLWSLAVYYSNLID